MRFSSLDDWLAWQSTLHPQAIDLGLERCRQVAQRLDLLSPRFPLISIAGTNGKGSCAAYLDSIYHAAGYLSARYTSPHLLRYNERVRVDGAEIDDAALCRAFAQVDQARGEVSLTYFEFGTLAAMLLFQQAEPDVAILEVGLGGRLDAVNLFDADIALITTIDLDHGDWLGPDRESIGFEKAGIFRPGKPVVCGDSDPPASLLGHAEKLGAPLYLQERDFRYWAYADNAWRWESGARHYQNLSWPALPGMHQLQNASAALQVIKLLSGRLPVAEESVCEGLRRTRLPGRFQQLPEAFTCIVDVAHNPQAAASLARQLAAQVCEGNTHALVGMLKDKDISNTLRPLLELVDFWHVADLDGPRAASAASLAGHLRQLGVAEVHEHASPGQAYQVLRQALSPPDWLVIFGSFYTVAEILAISLQNPDT